MPAPSSEPALSTLPAGMLGAPGYPDPQRCAAIALQHLEREAGDGMRLSSFSLDVAHVRLDNGGELTIEVMTGKRTRTIAFVSMSVHTGDTLVLSARGLFNAGG